MRELCPEAPVRAVSRSYDDDACKTGTESARWYALTVRHQQERQTERSLKYKGWETLVPVYVRRTRWSDRIKEVECPLFSGYILCHFPLEERIRVLDTPGVAKLVGFGGVPAAIEEREIEEIRLVVESGVAVRPWPYLKAGDRVRVEHGPLRRAEAGRFVGRIWVEDQDNSIVRFNGTYNAPPAAKGAVVERYFHFDSWRVNVGTGQWAPAQIYVEEEGAPGKTPRFKAQTRIWDYAAAPANKLDELTKILIENDSQVTDQASSKDVSPLESQRSWEHQAEENILARLEKGGLLAPAGPVDEVLNTVVNNLIVSANLNIEAHCRVLLTTPIETFSIGHTIVISRGLIDVLPDEASLALVLADELSHIALGHRTPTQFAFHNQTMLSDAELLQRVHFERTPQEMLEAGKKTIEIMRASPYPKTASAGLFLKALSARSSALPRLLAANLGNQVANAGALERLAEFTASAPELEENKLEQIAALPLGSRIKLNPWTDEITLIKTRPIALLSPREKMPFEVTPFVLYLTR